MVNLTSLDMSCNANVSDLAPFTALVNLQSLNISFCPNVSDLSPLSCCTQLSSLRLGGQTLDARLQTHHIGILIANNPGLCISGSVSYASPRLV
jgi:hypothetical protein